MEEKLKFKADASDDDEIEFFILEETRINNKNYLLVTDSEEEEAEAYILKDLSEQDEEEAVYEFVENEDELQYVSKIFAEMLDDEIELK